VDEYIGIFKDLKMGVRAVSCRRVLSALLRSAENNISGFVGLG